MRSSSSIGLSLVYGTTGKGRLGCPWYQLSVSVQASMVNRGQTDLYQSGLENQDFGHLSLPDAMRQGKVHASGHFSPHSACLALLRSYKVPITEESPPPSTER